jgi:hypothetical protein
VLPNTLAGLRNDQVWGQPVSDLLRWRVAFNLMSMHGVDNIGRDIRVE